MYGLKLEILYFSNNFIFYTLITNLYIVFFLKIICFLLYFIFYDLTSTCLNFNSYITIGLTGPDSILKYRNNLVNFLNFTIHKAQKQSKNPKYPWAQLLYTYFSISIFTPIDQKNKKKKLKEIKKIKKWTLMKRM